MWSVAGPSRTRKARASAPFGGIFAEVRMPLRLPSPSSPTFASSNSPQSSPPSAGDASSAFATASSAASPAPLSATPGPAQPAVGLHLDLFRRARGEHRVQVRREHHASARRRLQRAGDHVARAVQADLAAELAQPCRHPRGSLLLEKGGRRDAADLKMLLVDPVLFLGEPLQALAHAGSPGELSDRCAASPSEQTLHCLPVYRVGRDGWSGL